MKADGQSDPSGGSPVPADGRRDEGRNYWKAAIAHLAPEKREAAWEFYLDRLESSAAADTLGGVMLLLEAHLAFFDDLPARLGAVARQFESAATSAGGAVPDRATPAKVQTIGSGGGPVSSTRRVPSWAVAMVSAAVGASLAGITVSSRQHFQFDPSARLQPAATLTLLTSNRVISVEPWYDPTVHRQRGCIVYFTRAAWSECTQAGGAKVYVLSPVEEVRRDLESLRQITPSPAPKVPSR